MQIEFLDLNEILDIHRDQIERYGGSPGVRDMNLLHSALAMPATGFAGQYVHSDIAEMAAAYLFHLVRNHPFVDGNKRVGAVAAIVFLFINGYIFEVNENGFEDLVLKISEGKREKSEIADFIRKNTQKRKSR